MSELGFRVGCKVEWRYYATEAEAKAAAEQAVEQAKHRAAQGYDFGYQCPGTIRRLDVSKVRLLDPELELDVEGDVFEVVFP